MESRRHGRMNAKWGSRRYDARHVALLAILIALCYVGRLVFQFLPNVQPMTAILLILTLHLGMVDGLLVASLSLFLSNMLLGMGPWLLTQLASFAILIILTAWLMRPLYGRAPRVVFVLFAFMMGILYGFVISLLSVKLYGIASFWPYYFYGFPFDLAHAGGTAVFYLILEPILAPVFRKFLQNGQGRNS